MVNNVLSISIYLWLPSVQLVMLCLLFTNMSILIASKCEVIQKIHKNLNRPNLKSTSLLLHDFRYVIYSSYVSVFMPIKWGQWQHLFNMVVYLIKYYCMHQIFVTEYFFTKQMIKYTNYIIQSYSKNFSSLVVLFKDHFYPELVSIMIMLAMISLSSATNTTKKFLSKDPCHLVWTLCCWVSINLQWINESELQGWSSILHY